MQSLSMFKTSFTLEVHSFIKWMRSVLERIIQKLEVKLQYVTQSQIIVVLHLHHPIDLNWSKLDFSN